MTTLPLTINSLPKIRLIADKGKILTNGVDTFEIIDVDTVCGWWEIEDDRNED